MLRKSTEAAPSLEPQPTLAQLDELIAHSCEAGLQVELRVEGEARTVAAIADLCAYRVVQECLTNALKHAPKANVHVLLRYGPRDLLITVVDDGPGPAPTKPAGHGLIGMKERVALVGGTLAVGPALGGGFRVEARVPIDAAQPPAAADRPTPAPVMTHPQDLA